MAGAVDVFEVPVEVEHILVDILALLEHILVRFLNFWLEVPSSIMTLIPLEFLPSDSVSSLIGLIIRLAKLPIMEIIFIKGETDKNE